MDEKEFYEKREKYDLVTSPVYDEIRKKQIEMIVIMANSNYEPLELRGMLRIIAKTDEWREDFIRANKNKFDR